LSLDLADNSGFDVILIASTGNESTFRPETSHHYQAGDPKASATPFVLIAFPWFCYDSRMSVDRAKKIKLLLFDVDGVLTDGTIWLFPAPGGMQLHAKDFARHHADEGGFGIVSQSTVEAKGFHAHDGAAISLARLAGIKTGLITKRISETVALRARDLRLEHVYQGIQDKLTVFEEILAKEGLRADQAAYVGDDVIDLPVMRSCGMAIAVANARAEVKADAHYVTEHRGGEGALRDALEYILKAQGKWEQIVREYIQERSPTK
jgi:3-deoxy-D-manno-octulosonate 8-phosphate phosphatase (KDO 8-P phosphatase)